MADKILLRAGNRANIPKLDNREIGFDQGFKCLVVGTQLGNVFMPRAGTDDRVDDLEKDKLTATKVAAQASLAADADTETLIAAFNSLVAAMKASGVMNT